MTGRLALAVTDTLVVSGGTSHTGGPPVSGRTRPAAWASGARVMFVPALSLGVDEDLLGPGAAVGDGDRDGHGGAGGECDRRAGREAGAPGLDGVEADGARERLGHLVADHRIGEGHDERPEAGLRVEGVGRERQGAGAVEGVLPVAEGVAVRADR